MITSLGYKNVLPPSNQVVVSHFIATLRLPPSLCFHLTQTSILYTNVGCPDNGGAQIIEVRGSTVQLSSCLLHSLAIPALQYNYIQANIGGFQIFKCKQLIKESDTWLNNSFYSVCLFAGPCIVYNNICPIAKST